MVARAVQIELFIEYSSILLTAKLRKWLLTLGWPKTDEQWTPGYSIQLCERFEMGCNNAENANASEIFIK